MKCAGSPQVEFDDAMLHVIDISKEQGMPTYRAADVLAEQRIAAVGQAKRLLP